MWHRAPSVDEERTEAQPETVPESVEEECATSLVTGLLGSLVHDIESEGLVDIEPERGMDFPVESPPVVLGPSDSSTLEDDDDDTAEAWIADLAPIQESSQPDEEEEESRCKQLEAPADAAPTPGIYVMNSDQVNKFDGDPYDNDDVVSLASADSWDEVREEEEANHFVSMAMKFARASVIAGFEDEDDHTEEKVLDHGSEQHIADAAETSIDTNNSCQLVPAALETCTKPAFQEALSLSNETAPVQEHFSPANFSQSPNVEEDIALLRESAKSASATGIVVQEDTVAEAHDTVAEAPDNVQSAMERDCTAQEEPAQGASTQSWRLLKRPPTPHASRSSPCSSRPKRLVFGAVVRGPAKNQENAPSSPAAASQSPTMFGRKGKRNKKPAVSFSMDVDDDSAPECGNQAARESSLTRSYDALGVELHSIHDGDESVPAPWTKCPWTVPTSSLDAFATRPSSTRSYYSVQESRPASGLGRSQKSRPVSSGGRSFELGPMRPVSSGCTRSAGRRTSMPSAMALDLGADAPRGAALPPPTDPRKDSRLLPSLSKSTSAGSIAWSVYMAKTAGKRADRGGRIAVF